MIIQFKKTHIREYDSVLIWKSCSLFLDLTLNVLLFLLSTVLLPLHSHRPFSLSSRGFSITDLASGDYLVFSSQE